MSRLRPGTWSLRTRLTWLFAVVFSIAGLGVVFVSYTVVNDSLGKPLPSMATFGDRLPADGPLTQEVVAQITDELQRQRAATLQSMVVQSAVALTTAVALATLVAWLLAGRELKSLQQISTTARQVSDTNLNQRVALVEGPPEVRELADSVDAMLARLDQSFDSRSRFVANASHELRTPIAVQRTLLEVETTEPGASADLKRVGRTLLTINERHERLVGDLLTLAQGEKPVTDTDHVDLADLVTHALIVLRHDHVTVTTQLATVEAVGSTGLLDRLVVNLVGNAVQHNEPGGWVHITTGRRGGMATLSVSNSGPIVADHEVAGLLQPFSRGRDRVGSGHGLGLSIAAAVVHSHHGVLVIAPNPDGGLTATVHLPSPH